MRAEFHWVLKPNQVVTLILGNSHEIISQIVVFLNYMDEQDIHDKKNKEE